VWKKAGFTLIRGKFLTSRDDIADVLALRRAVFSGERIAPEWGARDAHDDMSVYALAFEDGGEMIASGRLYVDGDRLCIGRLCVKLAWRGRGVGDFVMRMLLYRAQSMNAGSVTVRALPQNVDFYTRYGFLPHGDEGYDGAVACRTLRVAGDAINLAGECGGARCAGCEKECGGCEHGGIEGAAKTGL
jgi:predicted GNAT family N-acyltransferase